MSYEHGLSRSLKVPFNQQSVPVDLSIDYKVPAQTHSTSAPLPLVTGRSNTAFSNELTTNGSSQSYTTQQHQNYERMEVGSPLCILTEGRSRYPSSDYYHTEQHPPRFSSQYDTRYDRGSNKCEKNWEQSYSSGYDSGNKSSGYDHHIESSGYDGGCDDGMYNYSSSRDQYHWEEGRYQSNRENPNFSHQPYPCSQDSFSQQDFPESYSRAKIYDGRYYENRPYNSTGYCNYSHNEYPGYYGNDDRMYRPKHKEIRSRKEKGFKSNDSFVQRRSAMFKRAQLQQCGKSIRSSRGPQIVKPHHLSDSQPDTLKGEKAKQLVGSFPKRNLDKFKIPKKKNASSASLPPKSSVSIPALDVQEKDKQAKSAAPLSVAQTGILPKAGVPVDGSSVVIQAIEMNNPNAPGSKTTESVKATQTVTSGPKIKKQQPAKINSISDNANTTVLSTLDPKTLFSLAVTLQKSMEKAKAEKNSATANVLPVPTSGIIGCGNAEMSVSDKPIRSLVPRSTTSHFSKPIGGSSALTAQVPFPVESITSKITSLVTSILKKNPEKSNTPLVQDTTYSVQDTTYSVTQGSEEVLSIAEMKSSKDISTATCTLTEGSERTSCTESININKGKSQGIVLAKVFSSSSNPKVAHTGENVCSLPISISSYSTPACIQESSSLTVASACTPSVTPVCKVATCASNSVKVTAMVQQETISTVLDDNSQDSFPCKRSRSVENDEENAVIAAKKFKSTSLDVTHSISLTTNNVESSEPSDASVARKREKDELEIKAAISDARQMVSEIVLERKPEPKPEPKSRRKSSSRSKKKLATSHSVSSSFITAVCCLCHKKDSELNLGFLFGPYRRTLNSISSTETQFSDNVWIHEGCAVWTPGICLVGAQLIGLQEALSDSEKLECMHCKVSGATLCCSAHNCKKCYHFCCASEADCQFDKERFLVTCSKHSFHLE